MEPIWVKCNEIDRQKWDKTIEKCDWGNIYSTSTYLDLITSKSWEALILGDYEYIMPVPIKKKVGIKYTYRPDFCQQLGVFSVYSKIDKNLLISFVKKVYDRFIFFIYPLNYNNVLTNKKLFNIKTKNNFILKLNRNYSSISSNYKNELKRNLKKAKNFDLVVTNNISPDELINIYKNAWQQFHPVSIESYNNFKKIIVWGLNTQNAKVLTIKNDNQILSACTIFFYKDKIYYPFSAITPIGRKYCATEYMINSIIKEHSNSPSIFDFEGSEIDSVKSFYSKFSPENLPYFHIQKNVYILELIIFFRNFLKNVLRFRKM